MCERCDRTRPVTADLSGHSQGSAGGTSRRSFLKSSAALATGSAAAQVLSRDAFAQGAGAADAELARVQGERRILLKGGVVLTLDRQVGDFAQADVLIEGGRIREVRPNIEVSRDAPILSIESARSRPARRPISSSCAPIGSTCGRSTT